MLRCSWNFCSDSLDNSIARVEQEIQDVKTHIRKAESEAKKAADAGDLTERDFWRAEKQQLGAKKQQLGAKEQQLRAKEQLIREEKARSEALQPGMGP